MKKIIVLGPVMPQASEIEAIAATLTFLQKDYQIDFIDPLSIQAPIVNEAYYHLWKKELKKHLEIYDAFFGFSFGGVILEQCFDLFKTIKKPIVLFSTPTFADAALAEKLGMAVHFCKEGHLIKALNALYSNVFYPNKTADLVFEIDNEELAASRLIIGLERALATDSSKILNETSVDHLHLIGECSKLVNLGNVIRPKSGRLVIVPKAGMRVLQDNPLFCQKIILDYLGSDSP